MLSTAEQIFTFEIERHKNSHIFLERWNWLPDGGFGTEDTPIDNRETFSDAFLKQTLG